MKRLHINIILLPFLAILLWSCEKDNYEPPTTLFTGQLVYNGKPFSFNGNTDVAEGSEIIQLFQYGFGKIGSLNVRVDQNGHFSSLLFNGDYVMIFKDQEYPFVFDKWQMKDNGRTDSLSFTLKGNKHMDIPVTPYFDINNVQYKVGVTAIEASFNIQKVLEGANVRKAYVYMSTAMNVNKNTKLSKVVDVTDIDAPVSFRIPFDEYRHHSDYKNNYRDYAYLRVAIETDKSSEYLWSPVYKLEGIPLQTAEKEITKDYLKNAGPGFECDYSSQYTRWGDCVYNGLLCTPKEWTINDAVKIYKDNNGVSWGGADMRWDRDRLCVVNWDVADILVKNGKIYQTTTLPAGKYILSAAFGELHGDNGDQNHCYMIINKGNQNMPDWDNKKTAFKYTDVAFDKFIEFELTEETQLTIGFLYNFPTNGEKCAYGIDRIKLTQILSENEE